MRLEKPTDDIIFIGLNRSAVHEAASIRSQGNKVVFIGNGKKSDSVTYKSKPYDLTVQAEIVSFVNALNLSHGQSTKLVGIIAACGFEIKDEIGEFITILAQMDKTRKGPTRLVLSGHSAGEIFWGEDNGTIELSTIKSIADALPVAASMIEDIHLSACYSGHERNLTKWREAFPNVSTIWAYSDSAPGSYTGATEHLSVWSRATRGNKITLDWAIAENTRKGKNVAVWSKTLGYQSKASSAINDLIARIVGAEPAYQSYFSGDSVVFHTQSGPLRDYYEDLQELVGHRLATPTQISRYQPRIGKTIRLIYFDKRIKSNFSTVYATDLSLAYHETGGTVPSFQYLSRKECLDEVDRFEQAAGQHPSPAVGKAKDLLVHGLKNLETAYIPESWI